MTTDLVPTVKVVVDGSPLGPEARSDLVSVSVLEDVGAPSMFTLEFVNWDMEERKVTWSDDALFSIGGEVDVQMGYVDSEESLIVGEITGLEPEFDASEIPTVTVRGYDPRHRLLRGRKTRSFAEVKDSDIASTIASDAGLSAETEDTKVTLPDVLQNNMTDMEFLLERARRIGYEVAAADKKLYFRPHQNAEEEAATLSRDDDLLTFYPRLTAVDQVDAISVRGWSPTDKEEIVGEAAAGGVTATMGGTKSGPEVVSAAFGASPTVTVDRPVFDQAEADQMALGILNDRALTYVTGEGSCIGRTDVRAGTVVKIEGVGEVFSGLYYVTSTTHTYSARTGYRTAFAVRRNAA